MKKCILCRAWVSTGDTGAWHPPKFWTSPPAPADFEALNTEWHPQSSFYVLSGTLSFKFLTQALEHKHIFWAMEIIPIFFRGYPTFRNSKNLFIFRGEHKKEVNFALMILVSVWRITMLMPFQERKAVPNILTSKAGSLEIRIGFKLSSPSQGYTITGFVSCRDISFGLQIKYEICNMYCRGIQNQVPWFPNFRSFQHMPKYVSPRKENLCSKYLQFSKTIVKQNIWNI